MDVLIISLVTFFAAILVCSEGISYTNRIGCQFPSVCTFYHGTYLNEFIKSLIFVIRLFSSIGKRPKEA